MNGVIRGGCSESIYAWYVRSAVRYKDASSVHSSARTWIGFRSEWCISWWV